MSDPHPPTNSLADFFELDVEPRRVWQPHELGAILHHQLSVPLAAELGPLVLGAAVRSDGGGAGALDDGGADAGGGARLATFGDVLHHPRPPVRLLELIKDFAKSSRADPQGALPSDVATVLYVAAVVVARVACGRRISRLTDAAERDNVAWVLARPWLDPPTRALFRRAWAAVYAAGESGDPVERDEPAGNEER